MTSRLRLRFLGDNNENNDVWSARENDWKAFWKSQGGLVKAGKVSTDGERLALAS